MRKVLVLEDDVALRAEICEALEGEGFSARGCGTIAAFWPELQRFLPDVAMLDLHLPDGRGSDVVRKLRDQSQIGILVLSGQTEEADRVIALEFGADDFVVKPCSPRELVARMNAILRRSSPAPAQDAPAIRAAEFRGFTLDLGSMTLRNPQGEVLPLTTAEFELLKVFVQRPQRVLSRDQLLDLVRGDGWAGYDRTVDGLVSRLRKKMLPAKGEPALLKTVHGTGYMFTCPVAMIADHSVPGFGSDAVPRPAAGNA